MGLKRKKEEEIKATSYIALLLVTCNDGWIARLCWSMGLPKRMPALALIDYDYN